LAPPAGRAKHWRVGRSARELATSWLRPHRPAIPEELAVLLVSRPETTGFAAGLARPEAKLRLDDHAGATRNADLLLLGTANGGRTLITIEAKADEPFGPTVADALASVAEKPTSNLPARISSLVELVFGAGFDATTLRYQLLHGLAATVLEAQLRGAEQAVFAVHEFSTPETTATKQAQNHHDLAAFLGALGADSPSPGELQRVPTADAPDLPVFIGLVRTDTTAAG
jgi:hypothetical protein